MLVIVTVPGRANNAPGKTCTYVLGLIMITELIHVATLRMYNLCGIVLGRVLSNALLIRQTDARLAVTSSFVIKIYMRYFRAIPQKSPTNSPPSSISSTNPSHLPIVSISQAIYSTTSLRRSSMVPSLFRSGVCSFE